MAVALGVNVGDGVAVRDGVDVASTSVRVAVGVGGGRVVFVGVGVAVAVGVLVGVGIAVGSDVGVGLAVGTDVAVTVGNGEGMAGAVMVRAQSTESPKGSSTTTMIYIPGVALASTVTSIVETQGTWSPDEGVSVTPTPSGTKTARRELRPLGGSKTRVALVESPAMTVAEVGEMLFISAAADWARTWRITTATTTKPASDRSLRRTGPSRCAYVLQAN